MGTYYTRLLPITAISPGPRIRILRCRCQREHEHGKYRAWSEKPCQVELSIRIVFLTMILYCPQCRRLFVQACQPLDFETFLKVDSERVQARNARPKYGSGWCPLNKDFETGFEAEYIWRLLADRTSDKTRMTSYLSYCLATSCRVKKRVLLTGHEM